MTFLNPFLSSRRLRRPPPAHPGSRPSKFWPIDRSIHTPDPSAGSTIQGDTYVGYTV